MDAPQRNPELEAAAFADVDDLDAWRVYADWLQTHGDPRGEIAGLAVELGEGYLSRRKQIAARLRELEAGFVDAWHAWAQTHDLDGVEAKFKRGFAWTLLGPLAQLRGHLDALFERDPITRLVLTEVDPEGLAELCAATPAWFERLQYLKLVGEVGAAGVAALVPLPLLGLRRLNLLQTELDDEACGYLARLQAPRLTHLTLTANAIGDDGVEALLAAPGRASWEVLYLTGNPITGASVARLAFDLALSHLVGLAVRDIEAPFDDFRVFADPQVRPSLRWLELSAGGWWRNRELYDQLRARFGDGLKI